MFSDCLYSVIAIMILGICKDDLFISLSIRLAQITSMNISALLVVAFPGTCTVQCSSTNFQAHIDMILLVNMAGIEPWTLPKQIFCQLRYRHCYKIYKYLFYFRLVQNMLLFAHAYY
jgi:hypothetical protein